MKKIRSEDLEAVRKLRKYTRKYGILIVLNILLTMLSSAVSSSPIALIKRLFDKGILDKNEKDILYAAGSMILLAILGGILAYSSTIFSTKVSSSIYKNIIDDVYMKVQKLDMEYFSDTKVGDLMTKVISDPGNINTLISDVFNMMAEIFRAIICLIIAFVIDWKLTLGVLIVAPPLAASIKRYSRRLKASGKDKKEAIGELNSKLQETLSGIRVIKAFATEKSEARDFRKKSLTLKRFEQDAARHNAKSNAVSEALNYIMIALLLVFGGYRVLRADNFTTGDFITIVGAISSMYSPIMRSIKRYNAISVNIPSIGRVFEILETESKVVNKENCIKFEQFNDNIIFNNVEFYYQDNKEKILKGINLEVQKGETVAFVGNSGGGKSTVVNLIPRFFDVTNGSIEIDGINLKDYDIVTLRKNIGIVPQETFLFAGTVLDNIKYGKQNATDDEVLDAAKKANADEFIRKLENGYNTEIGERGVKLSGGQKQRIAIARAILENPQILILDEATSALDNESEKLVQDALEKLMEGKTTFVIAHRLSTIVNSDKIVVIQNGEIKEIGNHQSLMEIENGIYRALYSKTLKE